MPDPTAIAARVAAKITEFGESVTIQAPATATAWDSAGTRPAAVTVRFMETGYSITHRMETAVQVGDLVGLVDADAGAIRPGWTLTRDGIDFQIVDTRPYKLKGERMVMMILARQ